MEANPNRPWWSDRMMMAKKAERRKRERREGEGEKRQNRELIKGTTALISEKGGREFQDNEKTCKRKEKKKKKRQRKEREKKERKKKGVEDGKITAQKRASR